MKKFYAFAATALAAVSMNAQLYVVGDGEGLAWSPDAPMVVEEANGAYTFEVANLVQFKISTTQGTWDEFNAGALGCLYTKDDLGKAVAIESWEANIVAPWKGDYTLKVVLGDNPTLTMTTTTPEPENKGIEIFVRGGMNEWGAPEEWKFTDEGEGKLTFVAKDETAIPADVEFKIADANWAIYNYTAAGVITPCTMEELEDEPEAVVASWQFNVQTNSFVTEEFQGTIFVTINVDDPGAGAAVVFVKDYFQGVSNAIVEANEAKTFYNLQGVKVENPTQGLYIVRQGGKAFKAIVK